MVARTRRVCSHTAHRTMNYQWVMVATFRVEKSRQGVKMAFLWRRSCSLLVADLVVVAVVVVCVSLLFFQRHKPSLPSTRHYMDHTQYQGSRLSAPRAVIAASVTRDSPENKYCSMGACFDVRKCRGPQGFKVYVYPNQDKFPRSSLFDKILKAIRSSPYVTSDPKEACLFVPSYDTLDRDVHSKDFVKNLPKFSSLPHWNGGQNHLFFVLYSGTWPNYLEELDFSPGQAMLAMASFSTSSYREGFDISLPLLHKQHPQDSVRSAVLTKGNGHSLFPIKRKYLLVFKGKRYLYGQGSQVRSSLFHLHNGRDIVMLTTCKHNMDWVKYTDSRCDLDNSFYDRYKLMIVLCVL